MSALVESRWRACLVALLSALAARSGWPGDPLALDEILLLLRSGLREEAILQEVRARSVSDPLTPEAERRLRASGATDALLEAIRERVGSLSRPMPSPPQPGPSPAEPAGRPAGGVPYVFSASAELVRVPVSVEDARGRPVTGLGQEQFRVWEQGEPRPITLFSAERKPLRIAVLLDVSGSMEVKIEEVVDALKHFMELLEAEDEMLVATFNDRPRVIQDFTSDRKLVARVLRGLRAGGGTALHDALIEGLLRLQPAPAESKALVLVSDGMDTASAASFEEALASAREAEVPVYSIGLGHSRGSGHFGGGATDAADFDEGPLLELAEVTGGRAEILPDAEHHHGGEVDRIRQAAEGIALTLRDRYLIGFAPPEGKPAWREIRVAVDRPGVTVRARRAYQAGR